MDGARQDHRISTSLCFERMQEHWSLIGAIIACEKNRGLIRGDLSEKIKGRPSRKKQECGLT